MTDKQQRRVKIAVNRSTPIHWLVPLHHKVNNPKLTMLVSAVLSGDVVAMAALVDALLGQEFDIDIKADRVEMIATTLRNIIRLSERGPTTTKIPSKLTRKLTTRIDDIMPKRWIPSLEEKLVVDVIDNEWIEFTRVRLDDNKTVHRRYFLPGQMAEYDRFNLVFFGPICSITTKSITIQKRYSNGDCARMDLYRFYDINWNFDLQDAMGFNQRFID